MKNNERLSQQSECTLVVLAKLKDRDAFSELVIRHQSRIRNLLRRLTGELSLADDLSQQTFLAAWNGIGNLKSNAAFSWWLKKLAVNTWLKHQRRKDSAHQVEKVDELDVTGEKITIAKKMDLDKALALLALDVRLCIVLCYNEGFSHSHISEITGLPLGTVKSHINRGSKKLREYLAAYGSSES